MNRAAEAMEGARPSRAPTIRVWDIAVRLFHWSLVAGMAYEFFFEAGTFLHNTLGQVLLGLIAFRVIWGFIGTRHARFADFVTSPAAALRYVRDVLKGQPARYIGHNPVGAMMVLALLTMVTVTAGTGWAMITDALWGQEWIEELHELAANLTLALVAGHVTGVIVTSWQHRENLVKAMVTGYKDK